ncbi:OmpH family outer membrane protein [Zophobihabitans entericus]|uniref:Molecular chaperone n=1 Tax=Zophobihabitans entericus TaxID=1635327 RepID=A0A6G9I9W4_9GAMM|nr:OmpH family outer membrane protein [Zophobihabitans entericus]QIQ20627.1 molecular chaperone [Zophobihabitans entericus]
MKKFIYAAGLSVALLFSGVAMAETKIAIVDVIAVLQQMPQRETVAKALEAEFAPKAKILEAEELKANDAAQRLKKDALTLSASEKAKLTAVITAFEDKAKEYTQEYRRRESEEANKLLVKIEAAVTAVAKEGQYNLVLKAEAAFYAEKSVDITEQVLQRVK